MTKNQPESLYPTDWKVMKVVWELKRCAARDVYKVTQELYGWAPGTTKTLLRRLVEKGHLRTEQVGNSYLYPGFGQEPYHHLLIHLVVLDQQHACTRYCLGNFRMQWRR